MFVDAERKITIPATEVDRLVGRFGESVRHMGQWNASGDGSLEIPIGVIREAVSQLDRRTLTEATLIESISDSYRRYLRNLMTRYQDTKDTEESLRFRDRLVTEIFGKSVAFGKKL